MFWIGLVCGIILVPVVGLGVILFGIRKSGLPFSR